MHDLSVMQHQEGWVCPCFRGSPLWELQFPSTFSESACNLVQQLLREDPERRLGVHSMGELKSHGFFRGLLSDVDELFQMQPPTLPDTRDSLEAESMRDFHEEISDDEFADFRPAPSPAAVPSRAHETDARTTATSSPATARKWGTPQWLALVPAGQHLVYSGLVEKRKGWVWRTRVLILTSAPRLVYYDPETREEKGEVLWTAESPVRTVRKSAEAFDVVCPLADHRSYHFTPLDPQGSDEWIRAIESELQKQRERKGRSY